MKVGCTRSVIALGSDVAYPLGFEISPGRLPQPIVLTALIYSRRALESSNGIC
jgi:hypothetical protein